MEEILFSPDQRTAWGPGPWQDEPDKVEWRDAATGLPCLIVRNHMGNLCGYAGVHKGHPLYAVGYSECVRRCPVQGPTRKQLKDRLNLAKKRVRRERHTDNTLSGLSVDMLKLELRSLGYRPNGVATRHVYRTRHKFGRNGWNHPHPSPESLFEVHGGITFSGGCHGSICHTSAPGERKVWWFGFDCGHYRDLSPGLLAELRKCGIDTSHHEAEDIYRTIDYVRQETQNLAKQLKEYRG